MNDRNRPPQNGRSSRTAAISRASIPAGGGATPQATMKPVLALPAEGGQDPAPRPGLVLEGRGDGVDEGLVERQGKDDADEGAHFLPRRAITFFMSSQTMRRISRLPSFRMR